MHTSSLVRRALVVGLVVLGGTAGALAQETLRYKWNKGDVIYYRSTQDSVAKMTAFGMTQDTTVHQEWVQRFEVKDVAADGVGTIDMSVVSVKITSEQSTGTKASFDSTKPAEQQFEGSAKDRPRVDMGGMVGEHVTVVIDGLGAVKKVEGMAKVIEKMLAKMGNINPMAAQGMRMTMGDESMRGNLERYFKVLPEKPVKTGDTWNCTFDQTIGGAGGRLRVDAAWTLGGAESAAEVTASKMTAKLKIDAIPPKEGEDTGITAKVKTTVTDGRGTAEALFDAKGGQLVKSSSEMTLPIESTMNGQGAPGGQSVTVKTDTTLKINFERIPAPEKKEEAPKPPSP